MTPRRVDFPLDPAALLERWPEARALAVLWSGDPPASRWSIFARPTGVASRGEVLTRLDAPLSRTPAGGVPFTGGLIGIVAYDAGRAIEPRAQRSSPPPDDRDWPDELWLRCDDALVHDAIGGQWWSIGRGESLAADLALPRKASFEIGAWRSDLGREGYVAAAARIIDYIRAGDVYQVNLAHRLSATFLGSARAYFRSLLRQAAPRFGAYLEADVGPRRLCIASASPEMFLAFDPASARLSTRPMKGTRPVGEAAEADLLASPKDAAELAMIVDLMRNDLGRVCDLGSVRVDEPRSLERHGARTAATNRDGPEHHAGLLQTTATVSGRVREGASIRDVLAATFPGGSITGAPKIRAMQIIDELEAHRRGPYCGAIGFVSDSGHAAFSIAIRTAAITGVPGLPLDARDAVRGVIDYAVGAGIVAESDPEAEWRETLDKAGVIRGVEAHAPPR